MTRRSSASVVASPPLNRAVAGFALALTEDPSHPFYSSWLGEVDFPVKYVGGVDLDYEPGPGCGLLITHDCYREPNVTVIRRAVERGLPVLILSDGIQEYRNLWTKPGMAPGAVFLPVLGHKIACYGHAQARLLESWGNGGKCEVTGAPRYDHFPELVHTRRADGDPFRILVATGMVPYHDSAQRAAVLKSLADLRDHVAARAKSGSGSIEIHWRLTGEVGRELGIDSAVTRASARSLTQELLNADALICWPSTIMIDAMRLGLPVAALDYCNLPHYLPTAWRITDPTQIGPTLDELLAPPVPKMLFQQSTLADALRIDGPSAPRMAALARTMMACAEESRRTGTPLVLSDRILDRDDASVPSVVSSRLAGLYPDADLFRKTDLEAMQVELGHLRLYAASLEKRAMGMVPSPGANPDEARIVRLSQMLPDARISHGDRAKTGIWTVVISGEEQKAMHLHPPLDAEFLVSDEKGGVFNADVALHPQVWTNRESGACEFRAIIDGRVESRIVIDPTRRPEDQRWHRMELHVPPCAGGHRIVLQVRGIGSNDFRWALWREPRFTVIPETRPS